MNEAERTTDSEGADSDKAPRPAFLLFPPGLALWAILLLWLEVHYRYLLVEYTDLGGAPSLLLAFGALVTSGLCVRDFGPVKGGLAALLGFGLLAAYGFLLYEWVIKPC